MKNIIDKLEAYLSESFFINKKGIKQLIPELPLSKQKEADLRYLMYMLRHSYYNGKYNSLVESLMAATDLVAFKKILNNSKIIYDLDDKILPLVNSLLSEDNVSFKNIMPRISPHVQKGLNELLKINLVEDGLLGEKTQSALDKIKATYNVSSNQEAIDKVLFLIDHKNDPGY